MTENRGMAAETARKKITELLTCGNERVELAAAKELVAMLNEKSDGDGDIRLEVTIKIV